MLESGEDPLYLARRLVRFASEDVGNADPAALTLALAAKDAYHFLGSPEGELALAQAALYLAVAPKSNAVYTAFGEAQQDVRERPAEDRKSTRLNSSHPSISYAVFCLKKKK